MARNRNDKSDQLCLARRIQPIAVENVTLLSIGLLRLYRRSGRPGAVPSAPTPAAAAWGRAGFRRDCMVSPQSLGQVLGGSDRRRSPSASWLTHAPNVDIVPTPSAWGSRVVEARPVLSGDLLQACLALGWTGPCRSWRPWSGLGRTVVAPRGKPRYRPATASAPLPVTSPAHSERMKAPAQSASHVLTPPPARRHPGGPAKPPGVSSPSCPELALQDLQGPCVPCTGPPVTGV